MIAKQLAGMSEAMGVRPSEIVAGGHAEGSFDLQVFLKARAE